MFGGSPPRLACGYQLVLGLGRTVALITGLRQGRAGNVLTACQQALQPRLEVLRAGQWQAST